MTRRLQVLFLLALVGVLVVLGIALGALAGPVAVAVYAALAGYGLFAGACRARAAGAAAGPVGRTCTCCTSTVHDPVQVR